MTLENPRRGVKAPAIQTFRLSQAAYEELERQLPMPFVGKESTELQAGFMLGVQHVLRTLRNGYTVGA